MRHTVTFVRDLDGNNVSVSNNNRPNILLVEFGQQILAITENATSLDFDCGDELSLKPEDRVSVNRTYLSKWLIEYKDGTEVTGTNYTLLFDALKTPQSLLSLSFTSLSLNNTCLLINKVDLPREVLSGANPCRNASQQNNLTSPYDRIFDVKHKLVSGVGTCKRRNFQFLLNCLFFRFY